MGRIYYRLSRTILTVNEAGRIPFGANGRGSDEFAVSLVGWVKAHSGRIEMTRSWIHFTRGRFVRQARVGLGDLREEHLSRQGFAGPVAMLYRTDGPNEVVRVEGDYRPRQIDSADVVAPDADDPRGGWQTLLSNDDVAVQSAGGAGRCLIVTAIWRATCFTLCIADAAPSRPNSDQSPTSPATGYCCRRRRLSG